MGLVLKVAPATPLLPKIPLLLLHVWALHLLAPQINKPMSSFNLLPHITPQANKISLAYNEIQQQTFKQSGTWM
jgi:hypothetical protein